MRCSAWIVVVVGKKNKVLNMDMKLMDSGKDIYSNSLFNPNELSNQWYVSISFGKSTSQNFDRALYLAKQAPKYSEQMYNGKMVYQATYGEAPNEFLAFVKLYELISNWKSTTVIINGEIIDRKIVGGLNYCYGDKCRSGNTKFCYGASYMTENPFGCHRLQISACNHPWWSFNQRIGNYYIIDKTAIKSRIDEYGSKYNICPCYNQEIIYNVLNNLPSKLTLKEYEKLCGGGSITYRINVSVDNKQNQPTLSHKVNNLNNISNKNKTVALILGILFGYLGVHRFYVGKSKTGILYLLTMGLFGIGWIYDIIKIVNGEFKDGKGLLIKK